MTRTCWSPVVAWVLALGAVLGGGGVARGGLIIDPRDDLLSTYAGAKNGAFDVISAGGTFDGATFHLFATLAGPVSGAPVGSTPLYVWGFNTGTGPLNFSAIGNPNVRFNTVATLNAAGATNNAAYRGTINGADISIDVPLAALPPSTGFAPENYLWNLWPRDTSAQPGGNFAISDFAPDNATAAFTLVPEPSTLVMCVGMFGALGVFARRRKLARNSPDHVGRSRP